MTLAPITGGSQRFTPPATNTIPDILGITRPADYTPSVRPVGQPRFTVSALGAQHPGVYYWRCELYDARGGLRQSGRFDEDHARASITDLVCDDQNILRLPFTIEPTLVATSPSTTQASRAMRANFLGREIFGFLDTGTQRLWAETSVTDPTPALVTGYAKPASTLYLNAMREVTINATPYLALGYYGAGGLTFQVLSDLSNPPTSSGLAGETSVIDGIVQTPIDNDAILYMAGGTIKAFATNIGVGSVVIENRQTGFPIGGYSGGLVALGGGQTQALWVVPTNSVAMTFIGQPDAAGVSRDFVGKAVLTDLRGWNPQELKFPLKYITFATVVRGGVFACDAESHYYHVGRSVIAVDKASDWPANSNKRRLCRGHYRKGDKIFWEVNEVAAAGVTANTRRWIMEYDVHLNTSRQVSAAETLSTGIQTVGGPELPASATTDYLTVFTKDGNFKQQYQPPANVLGFAQRKTVGATAATGHKFEASGSMTWGPQEIPGLEGASKIVARITAPPKEELAYGGAGQRLVVTAGGKTATFNTQVPDGTEPFTDFENNNNWFQRLTVTLAASRSTTATDATRLTGNYFPVVIEGFAVKRPIKLPADWRGAWK